MIRLMLFLTAAAIARSVCAQQPPATSYPKTAGYISVIHPLITIDKNEATYNFSGAYTVGFPCGVNILKSDKAGFSFELTPFIRAAEGVSKVSNVLFHPGVMFRYPNGFTFIARLAFETAGRYGATAVFNKVIIRTKMNNYFIAAPLALRFGNEKPASIGTSLQLGITF